MKKVTSQNFEFFKGKEIKTTTKIIAGGGKDGGGDGTTRGKKPKGIVVK
ncbi:MAG: hypothetical protein V3V33_12995 [Candidatus Lokiarchaeia archaeon]